MRYGYATPARSTPLVCVSDAGPCGSWLSRSLLTKGDVCWVVAPAVMPNKPGDRGNTDRRDARHLARLRRSGALPPGEVPAVDDEASRALRRARAATRRELHAAQCRRQAVWLRHDIRSTGRAHWRPPPRRGLRAGGCPTPAPPMVLQADGQPVTAQTARVGRRARARHEQGPPWRGSPGVAALQAWRGVPCPVAVPTVAARGDRTRCAHPRPLLHALGRTPADSASGARRQQGRMTKTGHAQARRALLAGAWASRYPANVRRHLPRRLAQRPTALQALSWQAQVRRCTR